jgi:hypothetical protein
MKLRDVAGLSVQVLLVHMAKISVFHGGQSGQTLRMMFGVSMLFQDLEEQPTRDNMAKGISL